MKKLLTLTLLLLAGWVGVASVGCGGGRDLSPRTSEEPVDEPIDESFEDGEANLDRRSGNPLED